MTDHESVFSIGALAEAAGVSPPTIRYYEEIRLIPPARRSAAGHRHYTREDVDRLTFIRRCRDFGFGLDQIRVLSSLALSPDRDCVEVRDIAAAHLTAVRARMVELRSLERQLQEFVETCEAACCGGPGRDCVALAELKTR
ncbi:MerR family transcriptional regulator [Maritimibacter sp. 55A14]|uniref:MerR family transcriptional regulator n=1 Tax=Maritimibacter sp. 55A14 TaxID=2174844 RepID=UPI000D61CF9B|nr:helix-turn-helix domain-containing protein [Maritimibacter sp. 55A14]PWE32366.1 MerR family transcriptional regulator [Maritimibacter sp. 55A14]